MPAKLAGETVTVDKANPEPSGGVERESGVGKGKGESQSALAEGNVLRNTFAPALVFVPL